MAKHPLERSERSLEGARLLLNEGLFDDVVPLAFHAAENAAREALQRSAEIVPKTHAASLREFSRVMSDRGRPSAGQALNRLMRDRQRVVYEWATASRDEAEAVIEQAQLVVDAARGLLEET
jgi:uncharacterized protein (UPF0332 family)